MLVFSYAAKLDDEWQATLRHWQPATFGFGADVLLLGATWDQVATRPTPGGGDKARTPPQLEWDSRRTDSWRQVLTICANSNPNPNPNPDPNQVLSTRAKPNPSPNPNPNPT